METNTPEVNYPSPLVRAVVDGIQEKKGQGISILDMTGMHDAVCDYMIIAQGQNPTQLRALEDSIWDKVFAETGEKPAYIHFGGGEWIGIDYGDVIVHILMPEARRYYKIEQLWEDAPLTLVPDLD